MCNFIMLYKRKNAIWLMIIILIKRVLSHPVKTFPESVGSKILTICDSVKCAFFIMTSAVFRAENLIIVVPF